MYNEFLTKHYNIKQTLITL